jgi:hypothetical protein
MLSIFSSRTAYIYILMRERESESVSSIEQVICCLYFSADGSIHPTYLKVREETESGVKAI